MSSKAELMAEQRIVVLTEGKSDPRAAKTATSVIRYRADEVVAVLDSTQVGQTSQTLLGVGGDIPVVASLGDAYNRDLAAGRQDAGRMEARNIGRHFAWYVDCLRVA